MMRDALAGAVRLAYPGVIVTEAEDYPSAWAAAAAGPDLVLCDLIMPGAAPEEGISGVQKAAQDAPLLVFTGHTDDALLVRLYRMGVAGLLPKSARSAVVESAIHLVMAGGRYVPRRLVEMAERDGTPPEPAMMHLSPRQTEILRAIAMGQTNKEIARTFDLSPATVKAHAAATFLALGVTNRTEAAFKARQRGLI